MKHPVKKVKESLPCKIVKTLPKKEITFKKPVKGKVKFNKIC